MGEMETRVPRHGPYPITPYDENLIATPPLMETSIKGFLPMSPYNSNEYEYEGNLHWSNDCEPLTIIWTWLDMAHKIYDREQTKKVLKADFRLLGRHNTFS